MRKLICLMLCILLAASMAVPAFATEDGEGCSHSWEVTSTQQPTCTEAGTKVSTCSGCGATLTESIAATGHSWQDSADTPHKRTCTVCSASETADHSWGEGAVTTAATCTSDGVRTYTCSCGATKTEAIPGGHAYSAWSAVDGYTHSRACSACGDKQTGNHSLTGGTVTVEPTCYDMGLKEYTCTVCGEEIVEFLDMVDHTYDNVCDPDCNVCGETRDVEHRYSKVWSKNASGHWHACARCGGKTDESSHVPGPAATEEKDQICLECGYVMTARLNHTHEYETKLSYDETGHWYACEGCEDQKDFESHVYDDLCDPDCNICGYVLVTAHSYGEWSSDETGHWATCKLCGEVSEVEAHTPDPDVTETEAQLCTVCGYEIAPAQVHEHEFGEAWITDEENHWKECECGEKAEEAAHSWDKGTKNEDSTVTYVCTECQAERTEGQPRAQRSYFLEIILVILILACIGVAVALVMVIRNGKKSGTFSKK